MVLAYRKTDGRLYFRCAPDRYRVQEDDFEPELTFVLQYLYQGNVQLLCKYLHIIFIPYPE